MSEFNSKIFKSYDVRGVYPDEISPELAYRVGFAYGKYLKSDLKKALPLSVVLGQDMRGSSPFLAKEVMRGLNDQGIDVVDIGRIPTPALYYTVAFKDYSAGMMVTASHNPKQYNGFKFCGEKATPIGLGSGLEKIRDYVLSDEEWKVVSANERGKLIDLPNMTKAYVGQDLSYLNVAKIKEFKIAADPGNSMGARYLDELFVRIPCDTVRINWELNGNMPNHEANPLKFETLRQLQEVMRNESADFGIAPDGDGDRIGFLDEQGEVMDPGIVLGLIAKLLLKKYPGSKIGYDLRASKVVAEMIEEAGGIPVETKVGHSNIKQMMKEQDILFSGELSMHYYFRENYNFESPIFVAGELLFLRSILDKPLSQIWRPYQKYFHSEEINFEVADKDKVLKRLEEKYSDDKISHLDGVKIVFDDWWFNIRPSNTEPLLRLNLEADTKELMEARLKEVKEVIK